MMDDAKKVFRIALLAVFFILSMLLILAPPNLNTFILIVLIFNKLGKNAV